MKNIRKFAGWRAVEIAKVFILNTRLVELFEDSSHKLDYIAYSINNPSKKIGIEIKATKYSKAQILKRFNKILFESSDNLYPVIIMFIDYEKENGYYKIIDRVNNSELKKIGVGELKNDLEKLLE